jgi:hypothetical protein
LVNSLVRWVILLGLDVLLIPQQGIIGAAIASFAAAVAVGFLRLAEVFVLFRMLPFNPSFLKPVAAGLVALVATWGTERLVPVGAGILRAALASVMLLGTYSGALLLLGLSQDDRQVARHMVRQLTSGFLRNPPATGDGQREQS